MIGASGADEDLARVFPRPVTTRMMTVAALFAEAVESLESQPSKAHKRSDFGHGD